MSSAAFSSPSSHTLSSRHEIFHTALSQLVALSCSVARNSPRPGCPECASLLILLGQRAFRSPGSLLGRPPSLDSKDLLDLELANFFKHFPDRPAFGPGFSS